MFSDAEGREFTVASHTDRGFLVNSKPMPRLFRMEKRFGLVRNGRAYSAHVG